MRIIDRIPGLVSGILFFLCLDHSSANLELSSELLSEQDYINARSEAIRSSPETPDQQLRKLHVIAITDLSLNPSTFPARTAQDEIEQLNASPSLTAQALYDLGLGLLRHGRLDEAVAPLSSAFHRATDRALFLRAACALAQLAEHSVALPAGLLAQVNSTRSEWSIVIRHETAIPVVEKKGFSPGRWMGQGIVWLYRSQIRPVIGRRCNVHPSCSEYFRLAVGKHGLMGFPLQADRFFREPEIVMKRRVPVIIDGYVLYADPLHDHDYWLEDVEERVKDEL